MQSISEQRYKTERKADVNRGSEREETSGLLCLLGTLLSHSLRTALVFSMMARLWRPFWGYHTALMVFMFDSFDTTARLPMTTGVLGLE